MDKRGRLIRTSPELWKRNRSITGLGKTVSEIVILDEKRAIRERDELKDMLVTIRNMIEQHNGDPYHLGVIDQVISDIMHGPSDYSTAREGIVSYLYENHLARFVPVTLSSPNQEPDF